MLIKMEEVNKEGELKRKLINQSLLAKLIYSNLLSFSEKTGEKSINYIDFKLRFNPRFEEVADFYRSIKFLEKEGLITLHSGRN
jgi:hypothetical protein